MITYNHEKYIGQAIDSVLIQETDFDYELVIGEDCSTDNTRAIVTEYQKQYPDKIRLLLPQKNLGAHENTRQTLAACCGEYTAYLEGDDYWTDSLKLQKQVDYLEAHPECTLCFHNVLLIEDGVDKLPQPVYGGEMRKFYEFADLIPQNFIITGSVVFRRAALELPLPAWIDQMPMTDWPTWLLLAKKGRLGYLPDVMSVYRKHQGGVWSCLERYQWLEKSILSCQLIRRHLPCKMPQLTDRIATMRREAIQRLIEQGDYHAASQHARKLLWFTCVRYLQDTIRLLKIMVRGSFPKIWEMISRVKK